MSGKLLQVSNICSAVDCELPYRARGYCITHLHRLDRGADMAAPRQKKKRQSADKPTTCEWRNCTREYFVKGLCQMHYTRQSRGREMDRPPRTRWIVGEKRTGQDGYVSIFDPTEAGARADGWIFEHRLEMQRLIGRALLPGENVHHRNGVRDDNRVANLELWVKTQPAGQRVTDLLKWARAIEAMYGQLADSL
jgi:hypothetical protein